MPFSVSLLVDSQSPISVTSRRGVVQRSVTGKHLRHIRPCFVTNSALLTLIQSGDCLLDADGRWQSLEHSMNEGPKTRILILGGGFAGLHVATHVDTETNDLGGFCFFHHHDLNSRRYQELPIAATRPPIGRFLLLSKLEERLIVDGCLCDLSDSRCRMITRCESAQDHRYPQLEADKSCEVGLWPANFRFAPDMGGTERGRTSNNG
jgi:hypothetical protein